MENIIKSCIFFQDDEFSPEVKLETVTIEPVVKSFYQGNRNFTIDEWVLLIKQLDYLMSDLIDDALLFVKTEDDQEGIQLITKELSSDLMTRYHLLKTNIIFGFKGEHLPQDVKSLSYDHQHMRYILFSAYGMTMNLLWVEDEINPNEVLLTIAGVFASLNGHFELLEYLINRGCSPIPCLAGLWKAQKYDFIKKINLGAPIVDHENPLTEFRGVCQSTDPNILDKYLEIRHDKCDVGLSLISERVGNFDIFCQILNRVEIDLECVVDHMMGRLEFVNEIKRRDPHLINNRLEGLIFRSVRYGLTDLLHFLDLQTNLKYIVRESVKYRQIEPLKKLIQLTGSTKYVLKEINTDYDEWAFYAISYLQKIE